MASSKDVSPIQINDRAFLIASTIERCPKIMMLRELVMNAIEAASLAANGDRKIEISAKRFDGVPKLSILNSGPGLTGQELSDICDLASSLGKQKGLDANFGMGAKVASLPSNRFGMRYRSCKSQRVHEVILCERGGVYGRLRRRQEDDTLVEVIDVTDITADEGSDLSSEWTEVVLLGNRVEQDTVHDPFDGDPASESQWIATYLYHRFYRMPKGMRVTLHSSTHRLGDVSRSFFTITERISAGAFDKYETVLDPETGIKIHYIYDGPYDRYPSQNRSHSGALQSSVSTCAVVHRDEMYDVRKGRTWTLDAPIFGIPFGARHISVHIELPHNHPVRPEGYRQFLRYAAGEQQQIYVTDFAKIVAKYRPEWLIDYIRQHAPDAASQEEIRNELQKLLDELRVQRKSPRTEINGTLQVDRREGAAVTLIRVGNGSGNGASSKEKHIDLSVVPTGAKRADIWQNRERAPVIIPLRNEAEIEEKQIKERAGRYYDIGQLYVNMLYPSIQLMREQLEAEYAAVTDLDQMREMALRLSEEAIILRVGRAVVYALAKQLNKEWDSEAVTKALSPESLSISADAYRDSLQSARRKMGVKFRVSGQITDRLASDADNSDRGLAH